MKTSEYALKKHFLKWLWNYFPWIVLIFFVIVVASMAGYLLEEKKRIDEAKKNAIKEENSAIKVITMTLEPRSLKDRINLPAIVESHENLWVKSEVSGQVVDILVSEGSLVEKGQILVKLDDRDYLSRLKSIEANYDLAKLEYDRISVLAEKRIAAATDLDRVNAQLKVLQSQFNEASLSLSRTAIKAPISGRLNKISAKTGDWMGFENPVAQILQIDNVKIKVGIPESDVSAVMDLEKADVIIEALNNRTVTGKKIFLSRQPGTAANLYDLELLVSNPDGRILPGMFARVELVKKVYENALVIPLYTVIAQQNEKYVFVEENGIARKRMIEPGMLSNWEIQVVSGLRAGDRVVVVGHRVLHDGQKIDIVRNVSDPREIVNP